MIVFGLDDTGTGEKAATIELAFDECVAAFQAAIPTSNTIMPTMKRRGARVAGTACAALMTVLFFLTC
jgi:hypothetical protein